jgi:hypothetical protein
VRGWSFLRKDAKTQRRKVDLPDKMDTKNSLSS